MKTIFAIMFLVVTLSVSAQSVPAGAVPRSDGGYQVGSSIWYPPASSSPVATTGGVRTPIGGGESAPVRTIVIDRAGSGDPTGVAGLRQGIVSVRPPSSGDARIDESNNRSDLEWGHLAQQRERDRARVELERAHLAVERERYLIRATLDRERQNQRNVESWSRVISDQLNGASRRSSEKAQIELRQREQRQREFESASRSIERTAEQLRRLAAQQR